MRGTTLFRQLWRCTAHLGVIKIVSSKSVFVFSTIDDEELIYPCFFCIQFFKQHLSIAFQHALAFVIQRKIVLVGDVYSKPPLIIKFMILLVGDIKRVVDEIVPYHKKDQLSPFFGSYWLCLFGLLFCHPCDGFNHQVFY